MSNSGHQDSETAEHIRHLEESLLDPDVRRDRARLREILDSEFVEFGSSGRMWTRNTIIELLQRESSFVPPDIADYRCTLLSEDVAHVTYRTERTDPNTGEKMASLRSSVWTRHSGEWRMRFHQGTRTVG